MFNPYIKFIRDLREEEQIYLDTLDNEEHYLVHLRNELNRYPAEKNSILMKIHDTVWICFILRMKLKLLWSS